MARMTLGSRMRLLAYGICALLTAALGDVLVEALQNARLLGTTAIDKNHQGVAPVLGLATLLLALLGAAIARDRFRRRRVGGGDRLLDLARDLARVWFGVRLITIVGCALVLVFVTEEYERLFGGAPPFAIADARISDATTCLAMYVACATLVSMALGSVMRTVATTCDALVRIVGIFATLLERSRDGCDYGAHARREILRRPFYLGSGPVADRAPPVAL